MRYKEILITDEFVGFHKYENAPDEVAFLRNLHRHIFKVRAWIGVTDNDREIEFFMGKKVLGQIITDICSAKPFLSSCEQIAEWILNALQEQYGAGRFYSVEVSEDGENGAIVTDDPNWSIDDIR